MPRKRPAEVRASVRVRRRQDLRTSMMLVSPYALAVIGRLEVTRDDLWPGKVSAALRMWAHFVRHPYRRLWVDYADGGCGSLSVVGPGGRPAISSSSS
jgi:hypothetical protein